VAHPATQVDIRNRDNVENGNDQFHGNRHRSEVNKLLDPAGQRSRALCSV
jgi:hypothetical protein